MQFAVILDFGYTEDPSIPSTIHDLSNYAIHEFERTHTIFLAQSATYAYLRQRYPQLIANQRLLEIAVEQSGTSNGQGVKDGGTFYVLRQAKLMIDRICQQAEDSSLPMVYIMAHKLHMPRALRQAHLVDLHCIAASYQPTKLYSASTQWWCRNRFLWYLREIPGCVILKLARQL